jgi:pimeloyl-ACP methyl ester carboxylesterase
MLSPPGSLKPSRGKPAASGWTVVFRWLKKSVFAKLRGDLVADRTVDTNGAAIPTTENGAGEPALDSLHYWGGSSRTWQNVIERLRGRPRSITLDQCGRGDSVVADGRYDLAAMANDAQAEVRAFELKRYVLVGYSMGGKVAQIVAARRPEGLAGVVLIAPAPPTPMPVPKEQRAAMLESYQSRDGALQALSVLAGKLRMHSLPHVLTSLVGFERQSLSVQAVGA